MSTDSGIIKERLSEVHQRIEAAGGSLAEVTVIAASKRQPVSMLIEAFDAGIFHFGENYSGELSLKAPEFSRLRPAAAVHWHAIGSIQRRHVAEIASHVALWHGVDRVQEGASIAGCSPGAAVLAQVNLTNEPTKGGVTEAELPALLDALRNLGLDVRGLMTMGPDGDPQLARPVFQRLRSLVDAHRLQEASMGMSADLEIAVQEGATMVRIGTALLGPRTGGP